MLKDHVSMDRVPYHCVLCSFQCMNETDLKDHLTRYARHKREAARHPEMAKDLTNILRRSDNPARDLESTFMRQMTKEVILCMGGTLLRWYGRQPLVWEARCSGEGQH